ncbi:MULTISPECIES: hypothetical protein [unclassified Rhizobium]|jgi:hypothetical protein|uniref:hypothetical protein n=1 Tax=unclassified Rhizobium TaxID=2613769 RepID=UPI00064714AB|nr:MULTISPECIES: hypothetical protein [unclassified Rhizobium]OJY66355.1 MAG: hypothetical protein BGP09_30935 [Rhizobium sp. 60-20]RKD69068.1 hypothetical protein BJ928_104206 [Rhizobium sp. WW_1]
MTSLLVLAAIYLLTALVLILIIDRSVGVFFPASAKQHVPAPHDRRFRMFSAHRNSPGQISEPFP